MKLSKNKFLKALDGSLLLLDQASINPSPSKFTGTVSGLLDQCMTLCESNIKPLQEPIRCIIHFGLPLGSPLFSSFEMMANTCILRLEGENFLDDLQLSYQKSRQLGQRLLIFCDYFLLKQMVSTDLLGLLNAQFKVKSIVIVTDPVDSYAIYCDAVQANDNVLSFNDYCQRILDFLKVNSELVVVRYEDLLNEPENVMKELCKVLGLSFCEYFLILTKLFSKNHNSKKKVTLDLITSKSYIKICELLDYHQNKKINNYYSPKSHIIYQKFSKIFIKEERPSFILLDSKSIPRSGLHYMKNTFSRLLGSNFSFCEWYQEQGCCKKMPCALTNYADYCKKSSIPRLRLVKSHDFNLDDSNFMPMYSARRVILIRNPLFVLTSFFALEQLNTYKDSLEKYGIKMQKIFLLHEPEILTVAYAVMDEMFVEPSVEILNQWLTKKVKYINDFLKKWVLPTLKNPKPFTSIISYENINEFIGSILLDIYSYLPTKTQNDIDTYIENNKTFQTRNKPFNLPSKKLSIFLLKNSDIFLESANKIIKINDDL